MRRAHATAASYHRSPLDWRHAMPWRHDPPARATGLDAERERLPRAIAARLIRAGRIAEPRASAGGDAANSPQPRGDSRRARALVARGLRADRVAPLRGVVETLFAQAGFATRSQAHGADGGVDIWLYSAHHASGDAPVSIVQCKQWMRHKVGVREVARAARRDGAARHRARPVRDHLRLQRRRARVRRRQRHRPARRRRRCCA